MNIRPAIFPKSEFRLSLLWSTIILCLASVMSYIVLEALFTFKENHDQKNKDIIYFTVTKPIGLSNTLFGTSSSFSQEEIGEIRSQRFFRSLEFTGKSNFKAQAVFFSNGDFRSEIILESVSEDVMDAPVYRFYWEEGMKEVPIIISSDFLQLYNFVYAPMAGLPPVSVENLSMVPIKLICFGEEKSQRFEAKIIGLSDRFSGLFVPKGFLNWANEYFSSDKVSRKDKMILAVQSEYFSEFEAFIEKKGYEINSEAQRLGKTASLVFPVAYSLLALFAAFIVISVSNFWLQWKWILEKQKSNLQILFQLGFHPSKTAALIFRKLSIYLISSLILALVTGALLWKSFAGMYVERAGLEVSGLSTYPYVLLGLSYLLILIILFVAVNNFCKKSFS